MRTKEETEELERAYSRLVVEYQRTQAERDSARDELEQLKKVLQSVQELRTKAIACFDSAFTNDDTLHEHYTVPSNTMLDMRQAALSVLPMPQ